MMTPFLRPRLAGATMRDRLIACVGAFAGIALAGWLSAMLVPPRDAALLLAAPMGASAVLVFAVPASPLAQPWSVVGGNMVSALVGVIVAATLPLSAVSAGLAVALAILAMSLTRSLHPPGGAAALLAVLTGASWPFVLLPIGVNAVLLAAAGYAFHRISGHPYPHRAAPAATPASIGMPDVEAALAETGEAFDLSREDLLALVQRAAAHAATRPQRKLSA